jgi:hypothetical protein
MTDLSGDIAVNKILPQYHRLYYPYYTTFHIGVLQFLIQMVLCLLKAIE